MQIQTVSVEKSASINIAVFSVDKVQVTVGHLLRVGKWNVVVENGSHKAFRGMGKLFDSADHAIAAYKQSSIKAALVEAKQLLS